jgi:hypothetical protein
MTNYEKVQISKSEPKKFSRLCTFKKVQNALKYIMVHLKLENARKFSHVKPSLSFQDFSNV